MFDTYNTQRHEVMAISSMQAIKLHKAPAEEGRQTQNGTETQGSVGQSLTMGQAEKLLKSLVEEGWLEKSQKGYYSLSPRALMELRGWLMEAYNDVEEEDEDEETVSKKIKQCFACKDIITTVGGRLLHKELGSDQVYRANDVRRGRALADYMIYAPRTSSGPKSRESVHYAKLSGRAETSWASERRFRRSPRQGEVGVELWPGRSLLSPLKTRTKVKRRMKTIEAHNMGITFRSPSSTTENTYTYLRRRVGRLFSSA